MKFFSLDIETTGLDKDKDQVLEIGVIFEDTDNPKSYEESDKFHAIIKHYRISGNPFALQMNNRLLEVISGKVAPPEGCIFAQEYEVMNNLACFIHSKVGSKFIAAGKNVASFDLPFLKPMSIVTFDAEKLNKSRLVDVKPHHRTLDVGPMYANKDMDNIPTLSECLELANLSGPTNLHSALGDSWDVIRLIRQYWGYGEELI